MRSRLSPRPLWRMRAQSRRGRGCVRRPCTGLPSSWCLAPASAPAAWSGLLDAAGTEFTSRITAKTPLARGFLLVAGHPLARRRRGNGRTGIPPSREPDRSLLTSNGGARTATAAPAAAMPAPITAAAPTPDGAGGASPRRRPRPQRTCSGARRSTSSPVVTAGCASLFPGGSVSGERLRRERGGLARSRPAPPRPRQIQRRVSESGGVP